MWSTAGVDVALLTGSGTAKAKRERRERVASGQAMIAVGTHALIEDAVEFAKLGVAVKGWVCSADSFCRNTSPPVHW
ncbi:MAG: hypothetical protein Q8N26_33540 [Myxococcales bacterium]|nr:hypothetical protein [Myxococcales bacterium]